MKMTYCVNDLLSLTRKTILFYPMVHNLTGRDSIYNNPGVSLQSAIVANFLNSELIGISGTLNDTIKECIDFSVDQETHSLILSKLNSEVDVLVNHPKISKTTTEDLTDIREKLNESNEWFLNNFKLLDFSRQESKVLHQIMYDLHTKIEDLKLKLAE